jgi:exopolysaccharide biosynthesis protein
MLAAAMLLAMMPVAFSEGTLSGYDLKTKTYTYATFGQFPTDADGTERGIIWRVLSVDDSKALLLSEYILEAHRIDPQPRPYVGWEKSELFLYLNGEFKNKAFSTGEQAALVENDDGGTVTLPTIDELRNTDYGFLSNDERQAKSTEYAKANGLYVYQGRQQYSPYWSRTPSKDHAYAHRRVMDDGKTGYICVEVKNLGMRPEIRVDLNQAVVSGGAGTVDNPYVLTVSDEAATAPVMNDAEIISGDAEKNDIPAAQDTDAQATQTKPSEIPTTEQTEISASAEPFAQANNAQTASSGAFDPLFPSLTADGFLPEGESEFVHVDTAGGVWLYVSDTLRIEIRRQTDASKKSRPLRWLEADVYVKDGRDFLKVYYNDQQNPKKEAEIVSIARKNHLVFGINSDWYYYRVKRNASKKVMSVGVILRQGEILYDDPAKRASSSVPNRDILALYPDADLKVWNFNATTANELKASGAYDVLSFGPVLLSDGEVTAQTKDISAHQSNNPRMGIGLVEKGHYVAIMAEGRISESKGCTLVEFAQMFKDKGCVSAYNLDGGGTATMMFMGEYINKLGSYTADKRLQIEVLGIGQSDQVTEK